MNKTQITEFKNKWENARKDKNCNIENVLELFDDKRYIKMLRKEINLIKKIGYRRRNCEKGEQPIEKILCDTENFELINKGNNKKCKLKVLQNAVYLASVKNGQIIADCVGILTSRKQNHPLAIEIKVTDRNPWYAAVESLQQVLMMRSNVRAFKNHFSNICKIENAKGTWGMMLAPSVYYEQKEYVKAYELCNRLVNKKTEARIIMASYDNEQQLKEGIINFKGGYWPK